METPQSKIIVKEKITQQEQRAVVDRFLEITNQKIISKEYSRHVKNLNDLLLVYPLADIVYSIEYLGCNPPPKSFYSLKYLSYVIPGIVNQRAAKEVLQMVETIVVKGLDVDPNQENKDRHKNQARNGIKGSIKF